VQFVTHLCFLVLCELSLVSCRNKLGSKGTPSVVVILCIPGILVTQEEVLNINKHTLVSFVLKLSAFICVALPVLFVSILRVMLEELKG